MKKNKELRDMLEKEIELYSECKKRMRKALKENNHFDWQYEIHRLDYHGTRIGLLNELLGVD